MRHPAAWIAAPTVLALLYVAAHALFAPEPTLADLPPKEAVLVQRFRNLKAFDRMQPDAPKQPSALLAENLNIPGLTGIDRAGPLHLVQLPRKTAAARGLVVLSVEDEDAVNARFHDIELIEQGFIRHAQHLTLRDGWAAFSPDRDVTRRLGEGGITAADREEDYSLAADVPRLIDHALSVPRTPPWRSLLESFGVEVTAAHVGPDGFARAGLQGAGRIRRLQTAWATLRMWAWFQKDGRPYVELLATPRAGPIADVLQALRPTAERPVPIPADADAWIHFPDSEARAVAVVAAYAMGFDFGKAADDTSEKVPPAVSALGARDESGGGFAFWTEPGPDGTAAFATPAPTGHLSDPRAWFDADVLTRSIEGFDVVARGKNAERTLDRYRGAVVARSAPRPTWDVPTSERRIATIRLSAPRAKAWLGALVAPGGLWALFDGRDLEALLTRDGGGLRLRIRAAP